jgi:hypothetical protein
MNEYLLMGDGRLPVVIYLSTAAAAQKEKEKEN